MLVKLRSVAFVGLQSIEVVVEVDVAENGFPGFTIVGLASKAVEEARERVKAAIVNSGYQFPPKRITVNLAPADLPKNGGAFDLAIALGILVGSGQVDWEKFAHLNQHSIFYAELGLDGTLRAVAGILLVALYAKKMQSENSDNGTDLAGESFVPMLYVPIESANEGGVVDGVNVYAVRSLKEIVNHIHQAAPIRSIKGITAGRLVEESEPEFDIGEVIGQESAKRALLVAAAGGHNLLFWGPPGTGKTMLARCMPSILPPLSTEEALDVTKIYSISGLMEAGESLVRRRPFRSPHHGVSAVGMVGGGSNPMPGEVSLAHHGVLFLDEMAEFDRRVIEGLRQPLEDGWVSIVRAAGRVSYPARFSLLAAVNPCPCGYLGHPTKACVCSSSQVERYRAKLSGPILDRIDLHVQVGVVEPEKLQMPSLNASLNSKSQAPNSKQIQSTVIQARQIQIERFRHEGMFTNAQMKNRQINKYARLTDEAGSMVKLAVEKFGLSTRAYFRVIKVSRTIADLDGSESVDSRHVAEALQYRQ